MKSYGLRHILAILVLSLSTIVAGFSATQLAYSQQTLDIKTPGGNEPFGGEKMGTVTIVPKNIWFT